jgi:hypothetical protein
VLLLLVFILLMVSPALPSARREVHFATQPD